MQRDLIEEGRSDIPAADCEDFRQTFAPRPPRAERAALGKALRKQVRRCEHAVWSPPPNRADPVSLIEQANTGRIPELIPIRHARMLPSPFTFYRGTALNMAADLAGTPATGLRVQVSGDAHLGNFRCFATPERRLIFDIHDLDETLPAPWEWDLKRLAASFVLAGRNNGHRADQSEEAVRNCVRSYREHMAMFSRMRALEVWYANVEADALAADICDTDIRTKFRKSLNKAKDTCLVEDVFPRFADDSGTIPTIKDDPPYIYHHLERDEGEFYDRVRYAYAHYHDSIAVEKRTLLDRYAVADVAIKVVGVGSVGTTCCIVLMTAGTRDPLFLQIKEARASVLEAFAGPSAFAHHGQRVVTGHRLMQAASDIFLGWTTDRGGRHYYVRQLRDKKLKFTIERFTAAKMALFAGWCGMTLARAHARSGDAAAISGYLGAGESFDGAIAAFATAYADQVERDYDCFAQAVRAGRLEVHADA
ncbi:MAG TPA: DUF2252 domain-containing protein [Gemmatales bacterium]|nr:DUF2252 domain-containing protein [Gemmatales bacterium]